MNWLTGGADQDFFVFDTAPSTGNFSTIMDFNYGDNDRIHLVQSGFTGFSHLGELTTEEFYAAAGAKSGHDTSDRVIYDTTSGKLYYDADGLGGDDAFQFATIASGSHSVLTYSDFQIIA
jgi:Ca2+-binding RTX toxin-like protein